MRWPAPISRARRLLEQGHRVAVVDPAEVADDAFVASVGGMGAPTVGIEKLELHVFPHNEPAIRLYERFGFQREGLRRAHYRRGTELVDAVLMAYRVG